MRFLITAAALAAFAFPARADEPKFFLNPDGTVEQRLAGVESKTVALEKRIADLERKLAAPKTILESGPGVLTGKPQTFSLSPPAAKIRFQTCVNGRCTQGECDTLAMVPAGATILSGLAGLSSSCPTGPCGDACGCATAAMMTTSATAFTSSTSSRRGLFGRRARGAGRCSTCGQ